MPPILTVVLDSNVYIFGINRLDPGCTALLDTLTAGQWEDVLIVSQNRHFLERLETDAFTVVVAGDFLKILRQKVEGDE